MRTTRNRSLPEPGPWEPVPPLLALALAATLFFGLAVTSLARKSATYDEPVYLVAGLSYWSTGELTMKEDAPPAVAYAAGLAALAHGLEIPGGRLPFSDSLGREYPYASRLLYGGPADADAVLFWARLAVLVPFGLLLLFTVQRWSTELHGPLGAALSLALVALSPTLLAHGRLVAADFACSASMLFASHRLWRFDREPSFGGALGAGLAVGLALITKYSALVLLPTVAVVLALAAWRAAPVERGHRVRQGALLLGGAAALVAVVHLPEPARFVRGVGTLYRNAHTDLPWYFLGSFHPQGTRLYYPGVLALKTSLPLLGLGLLGAGLLLARPAARSAALCLLLPAATLLAAAAFDPVSSGVRRVLPVLPVLAVAAGRVAALARSRAGALALVLLVAFHAASSARAWPHYIPYFNELALAFGEPQDLLDDCDVDWGQDLVSLPASMRAHRVPQVNLLYFGTADPDYYGIAHRRAALGELWDPLPGVYAVSLHRLIRARRTAAPPFAGTAPFAKAGTSIWLFRLDPPETAP